MFYLNRAEFFNGILVIPLRPFPILFYLMFSFSPLDFAVLERNSLFFFLFIFATIFFLYFLVSKELVMFYFGQTILRRSNQQSTRILNELVKIWLLQNNIQSIAKYIIDKKPSLAFVMMRPIFRTKNLETHFSISESSNTYTLKKMMPYKSTHPKFKPNI